MNERRWTNQTQPQTLQIAVFLLYFRAFFLLLTVLGFGASALGLLFLFGFVYGGYGVANEQKSGYQVAIGVAVATIVLPVLQGVGVGTLLRFDPIGLMFDVALVALLLHPMSRDYQRLWFR